MGRFDLVGKNGSYTLASYPARAESVGISAVYRHFGRYGDGGFPSQQSQLLVSPAKYDSCRAALKLPWAKAWGAMS
jgi:hypothetical protein